MLRHLLSKKYTVRCPDGTVRAVYHNINDVFPLHIQHAKGAAAASINALNQLKAKAELKNETKLSAILTGIDKTNQSIQNHFRAAYAIYEASPCTELPYLKAAVERIIVDEQRLRSVETVVSRVCDVALAGPKGAPLTAESAKLVSEQLSRALEVLAPPQAQRLVEKMAEVTDNTAQWAAR